MKSKEYRIKIYSKEEFTKILINHLVNDNKDYTLEQTFYYLIEYGFSKLDFEDLNESLQNMRIFLPTMCVDSGNQEWLWVVNGCNAILVKRD